MWFLEHDSLFGGKRVWLRPGSQQLFGRTKSGEQDGAEGKQWKIDNKAVSRKHVMLKVHEAAPNDGTKLHARSKIEVIDLSCRQGTTIDEKTTLKSKKTDDGSLDYDKATLAGTEHTIRLAQGYLPFKIVWRPMVFTYASRESKESKVRSARLHALDIKTTGDFLFDKTTHVVSQKRNLPKVLSGLVAGKHIVTGDFLDDVLKVAATSVDDSENYLPSKLEEDFDEWWPKEKECIPPVGAEPVPRPSEMLEPDSTRQEVFSGLTFIFMDENQYNSLLDPVTGGGGKGLHYEVRPGETTVQDYVDYVHSVAGKKKRSRISEIIPVVTVRLAGYPEGMEEWAANFVTGVDQALNQRSILQNEFLDVIITKDRASLQRPPAEIVNTPSNAPEPAPTRRSARSPTPMSQPRAPSPAKSASPEKAESVKAPSRKRVHRPRTGGRFTGFDDYEPPPKRTKVEEHAIEDVQESVMSVAASQHRAAPATQTHTQTQHTRVSPAHDTVDREEQMDTLFPAAAKIKRQRAATRAPSASVEPEPSVPVPKPISKGKAKIEVKDINVREQTRLRVKEEEDRRKADEESLREALEGIDIAKIRDITQVVDMELRPRSDRVTPRQSQADGERWNQDWNGRKNFKKFRRRGAERGLQARKVLVPFEEAAPKKGFGVGDAFFLEDVEPSATFRSRNSRRENEVEDDVSDAEPGFRARKRSQAVEVEDSGLESEEEGPVHRTQRSSGRTQTVVETQVEDTQNQRGKKRGATAAPAAGPASKRRAGRRDDDSDEEETGFRFKRRG
ncbi:hypothetical protein CC86DRAFT_372314 [Ophiobolus disseminans]|uniref:FHA domain-containing protein n=1 Tax=Ophiobolus disseminans TaxID=1469910 RepID=A0A6A6ZRS8_9PLEO|nr:hypothetical protein CC86DRAFT_372314 [Ophiobolus disseminans]